VRNQRKEYYKCKKALLLQGEPRDVAVNFDTYRILQYRLWAQSEQKPIKNSGKVAVGVVRDSGKFSGRPYIGRIARSSLR